MTRGLLTPRSALAASFQWFDKWWADARCDPSLTKHGWDDSGSTAVISMVSGQQLVVANAGAQGWMGACGRILMRILSMLGRASSHLNPATALV